MSKRKELPGFYYDEEKNRYFPIKGPIPGSKSTRSKQPSSDSSSNPTPATSQGDFRRHPGESSVSKLVQARELHGNALYLRSAKKQRCRFQPEFLDNEVSRPQVWRYGEGEDFATAAVAVLSTNMVTPEGETQIPILLAGNDYGLLSSFGIGKCGQHLPRRYMCEPVRVLPGGVDSNSRNKSPPHLWHLPGTITTLDSQISCIKSPKRPYFGTSSCGLTVRHALITTLGSDRSAGSIYVLDAAESIDSHLSMSSLGRIIRVVSLRHTIWTADWTFNNQQAVVGINKGASLVDLENGKVSRVLHCESDVLALQFDHSGNGVICGLRNGAILTLDIREGHSPFSNRRKHQIPYLSYQTKDGGSMRKYSRITGNIHPSCSTYMPNSISSLMSLQLYDQYFIASSMDGSIKLYDQRLMGKGCVQSYEGHKNTHTRLQLGVDPAEKFVLSGGEDCGLRVWNIKSGILLFENQLFPSYSSALCTNIVEEPTLLVNERQSCVDYLREHDNCWGSWHGTRKGLFYTRWC